VPTGKVNENLRLFEIVTGDNDLMTGPGTTEFESRLRALNMKTASQFNCYRQSIT
jgi:hypothetical protein